jgi:SNF2 family DNA or RNA helicase
LCLDKLVVQNYEAEYSIFRGRGADCVKRLPPVLVLVPAELLDQWQDAIKTTFGDHFEITMYYGTGISKLARKDPIFESKRPRIVLSTISTMNSRHGLWRRAAAATWRPAFQWSW